jgi:methyl-accepting chemotaxis protein
VKLTIRMKLLGSFVLVLLLLVATSAVAIVKMGNMGSATQELTDRWMKSGEIVGMINADATDTERLTLRIMAEPKQSERDRLHEKLDGLIKGIDTERNTLESLLLTDDSKKSYQEFSTNWVTYRDAMPTIEKAVVAGDTKQASLLLNNLTTSYNNMSDALDKMVSLNTKSANLTGQSAVGNAQSGRTLVITFSVAAIVLAMLLVLLISYMISTPVLKIAEQVKMVADGDLTVDPLQVRNRDELGDLANDFNRMTAFLRNSFGHVATNAHQVASTSEQLTASAEQTTHATEQIAEAIQLVAMGTDQQLISATDMRQVATDISGSMQEITANIQTVTDSSMEAASKAGTGQQVIGQVISQMSLINERVRTSAGVVQELGVKSTEIESITALITSIAAQTNLLALNAAIEAARAGEHGRGFAVVADEVRKLAEQSGVAAEQVQNLIGEIQKQTTNAITAMEHGTEAVNEGIVLVNHAGAAFEDILQAVDGVSHQTQGVAAAVQQVNAGTQMMAESMTGIAEVSEQSATNTQQVAASVEETNASMQEIASGSNMLAQMSEELLSLINKFQI